MRFLLAFLCPPLAVLLCGRPFLAIVSVPLTILLFWIPGTIFALFVVANHKAEKRNQALIGAVRGVEAQAAQRQHAMFKASQKAERKRLKAMAKARVQDG